MTKDDVFIDGEGMVHRFHFEDGQVDYRSRWVRNERFKLQEPARRSLFGRYRNRYTDDPSVAGKNRGTANTNVVWHGKRLLVLKEDSLPIEVDPVTLETRAEWNCGGKIDAVSLTAHPKLDLHTNELLAFSYQARGDATLDFAFYILDADGKVVHQMWFEMPYPGMVHDFAVTDTHVIVPFFPLITDLPTIKRGGPYYLVASGEAQPLRRVSAQGQCEVGALVPGAGDERRAHDECVQRRGAAAPGFVSVPGELLRFLPDARWHAVQAVPAAAHAPDVRPRVATARRLRVEGASMNSVRDAEV